MSDITLMGVGSVFGEGTTVAAFVAGARSPSGGGPSGSEVAHADVTDDDLALTGLVADTPYVAYAEVAGEHRYVAFRVSAFVAGVPWKTVVADRRAAIGTS